MTRVLATILLDTSVLKAAKDSELVFLTSGLFYENQNVKLLQHGNQRAFNNRLANRKLARLAREEYVSLLRSNEVLFEAMGVPAIDFTFFRSNVETVEAPIKHFGLVIDGSGTDHLYQNLSSVKDSRFLELQKLSGAYQGETAPLHRNQLLDAFHLWCAEHSESEFFLTHDEKLIKLWNSSKYKGGSSPINTLDLIDVLIERAPQISSILEDEARRIEEFGRDLTVLHQPYAQVDEDFLDH